MRKVLMSIVLVSGLVGCTNDQTVTETYVIDTVSKTGYHGVTKDQTGIYLDGRDVKQKIEEGDVVKITFTKAQYETMEGFKKIEVVEESK